MSGRPSNLLKSKMIKQLESGKKPNTPNSLYSGLSSAQRSSRQQRYFGSASLWHSAQSRRGREPISAVVVENPRPPQNYHSWNSEYNKIVTRERILKPMTKDPYTPIARLITQAVECVTTEAECCTTLIPANAVKIRTVNVQQSTRPSLPRIVRYLRRDELMPSEQPVLPSPEVKFSLRSRSHSKKPSISVTSVSKITGVAPTLATTNRLLNRAKMHADTTVIRRPPRKLMLNASHETIMPLSVYG